LSCRR